ncbi:MAG: hypothetical protein QXD03_02975 [Candidatus Anstonellales archaeon]
MLILIYSLLIILTLSQTSSRIDVAYSINNTDLGVYIDNYHKLEIRYADRSYSVEIYRYIYPRAFDVISPMFIQNETEFVEKLKTDLTEQLCLERLPRGSIPQDFNDLMNRKYSVLSLYEPSQAIYWYYIYDYLTYNHPFNQEVRCISLKQMNFSIRPRGFVETYVVRTDPSTRDVNIRIPQLNYSSFSSGSNFIISSNIQFYTRPPVLDIIVESVLPTDNIPVISELLQSFFTTIRTYYEIIYSVTKKSYLSVGIVLAMLYIAYRIIIGGVSYLSSVLNYYLHKDPAPIKRALGYHNTEIYANLVKGGIAAAIAIVIEYASLSQNIYFNQISLSLFVDMLKLDITFYIVIFGIVFFSKNLFEFILDHVKGLIGGQEFYTSYSDLINKSTISSKLSNLKDSISEFRQELGKGIVDGVDVSKYLEFVNSIPIDSLQLEINNSNSLSQLYEVYQKIKNYTFKIDELRTEYKNLYRDAENNYTFWKDHVKKEIKMFGAVNMSSLTMIPAAWRSWFAKRFVEENPDYVVTEGMIKRLDIPKSEVLKIKLRNMFDDYYGDVAVLFSDGEFLYSGNSKTMVKAVMSKIIAEDKDIEVEGEKYSLVSFSKYGIRVLVFGKKDIMKDFLIKYNL